MNIDIIPAVCTTMVAIAGGMFLYATLFLKPAKRAPNEHAITAITELNVIRQRLENVRAWFEKLAAHPIQRDMLYEVRTSGEANEVSRTLCKARWWPNRHQVDGISQLLQKQLGTKYDGSRDPRTTKHYVTNPYASLAKVIEDPQAMHKDEFTTLLGVPMPDAQSELEATADEDSPVYDPYQQYADVPRNASFYSTEFEEKSPIILPDTQGKQKPTTEEGAAESTNSEDETPSPAFDMLEEFDSNWDPCTRK